MSGVRGLAAACLTGLTASAAFALSAPAAASAAAPVSPRPHTVQVAIPRDAEWPFSATDAQLIAFVASAADRWRELSEGQITSFTVEPTVDVLPPERYAAPCDLDSLMNGARDAYPASRFSRGPSQTPEHLVVLVPDSCPGRAGLGTIGLARFASGGVVVSTTGGSATKADQILTHELGHNFGLSHSAGGVCDGHPEAATTGACRVDEYFGYPELMSDQGSSATIGDHPLPVLGAVFRDHFGLEAPGESETVDWSGEPARSVWDYTLRPRADAAGLRAVRVADPHTGRRYVLEYRSGTGRDLGAFYASGQTIRPFLPNGQSVPVTMTAGVAIQEDAPPPLTSAEGSRMPVWIYDLAAATGNFGAQTSWFTPNRGLRFDVGAIVPGIAAPVRVTVYRRRVTATAPPTIVGRAQVGETLRAEVTGWTPAPDRCEHQWLADDAEIAGASSATLTLDAALLGARLRVRTACSVDGAAPVEPLTSAETPAVVAAAPDAPQPPTAPEPPGVPSPSGPPLVATPSAPASSSVRATVAPSRYGRAPVVRVTVDVASAALQADGVVRVRRAGRPVGEATLRGGRARVTLPAALPPGRHRLTVEYAGSDRVRASRTTVTMIRRKLPVRTTLSLARTVAGPRERVPVRLGVASTVPRLPAVGTLVVTVDGATVGRVRAGRAPRTFRLPPLRVGRHRVAVRFTGSVTHAAARSRAVVLTIRTR